MVEPLLQAEETRPAEPRPLLGYAMVLTAATLWAVNGIVSKVILDEGVSAPRLSEVRSTGAFLGLTTIIVGVLGMAMFNGDVNKVYALFFPPPPVDDPRPAPVLDLRPMYAKLPQDGGTEDQPLLNRHGSTDRI